MSNNVNIKELSDLLGKLNQRDFLLIKNIILDMLNLDDIDDAVETEEDYQMYLSGLEEYKQGKYTDINTILKQLDD